MAPASDPYDDYMLLFGLTAGSIIAIAFWIANWVMTVTAFIAIQLGVIAIIWLGAWIRTGYFYFIPPRIKRHRAARRAAEEFASISRSLKPATPLVLLFVSIAEHHVQILTNSVVREKIPDASWQDVLDNFTTKVKGSGLRAECIEAVNAIAARTSQLFPDRPGNDSVTGLIEL